MRGYITHKAKRIQPEDGLRKAETCRCVTYCTTQYNKFCCVSTVSNVPWWQGTLLTRLSVYNLKMALKWAETC